MNAKTITTFAILMFSLITVPAKADDINQQKAYYQSAKQEIGAMLEGRAPLSYERAIYLIENAWYDNVLDYENFQSVITYNTDIIRTIARQNQREQPQDTTEQFWDALKEHYRKDKGYYEKALTNWAIFKYMTDTTLEINNRGVKYVFHKEPLQYSTNDPFGTTDWTNTQIIHLLETGKGNCFALTSLYKIFSERLNSDAYICTAPGHIYISHRDSKGTMYNVELASKSFPGTGTLSTLTYTTVEAIRNNISLRQLDLQQSVALSLIYLAKGYQHKFNTQGDDDFLLACAELALKYDTLNLNALLLKAEVLETKLVSQQKEIQELQNEGVFIEYQNLIVNLYQLGYREMPLEMKNFLIKGWSRDSTVTLIAKENNPDTYNQLGVKYNRYASLSWGLFDEEIRDKPIESYSRTLFDVKTKTITGFGKKQALYNNYDFDPVVFAWSVDPMAHKMPGWSPYAAFADNPIVNIDPDGNFPYTFHVRAFAPKGAFKGFGGFHDDGRGYEARTNVTSRIKQNFTIDPTARTFSGGKPTSDPTIWGGLSKVATNKGGISTPDFSTNSMGSATAAVTSHFEGSNPFGYGAAPNISVSSAISITENLKKNQLHVSIDISSKQFPATDALIQDNAGNTILLGGAAAFGNPLDLVNSDEEVATSVDLIIGINNKGVFQNVTVGGQTYTPEEFNKIGTSKSAGPFPREDKPQPE